MARRRNYDNSYNRNSAQSRMFSVSANNPYAFQNQFVGKAGSEAAQEKEDKKQEEFEALQEERKLREEKLKDLSRTYIDQFPPGADVSDASQELGSIITQEMTTYRNDYGQLAIGYPKAEIGSEQSGTIKAGMDEVISNANSLNNQVASWTEMKKDILQKASTSDYENQFSRDAKNIEVADELLEVFTGKIKAEIRDGKIGYQSTQKGEFVTVKEMKRMLPFGKANDYRDNFIEIRQQVVTGKISKDALEAFTQPLRTNLDGEEGLKTALSLAADDILLPGTALMSQEAIDNDGTEVESGFAYDFDRNGTLSLIETKILMDAVYSGDKKAERILKDEVYRRLNKSLNGDADNYQKKLTDAATAEARLKDSGKVDSNATTNDANLYSQVDRAFNNVFKIEGLEIDPKIQNKYQAYMLEMIEKGNMKDPRYVDSSVVEQLNKEFAVGTYLFVLGKEKNTIQLSMADIEMLAAKDIKDAVPLLKVPLSLEDPNLRRRITDILSKLKVSSTGNTLNSLTIN